MVMENQHTLISGYRDLTKPEIDAINEVKKLAESCGALIGAFEGLAQCKAADSSLPYAQIVNAYGLSQRLPDPRWLALAKTDLQRGLMALTRAIAKPDGF